MVTQLGRALCREEGILEGALILAKMDGKEFSSPINADIVKKYYV